jgi:hypothetical protein
VFDSIADLQAIGFSGFRTIGELRETRLTTVPEEPGVYVVVRPRQFSPVFLAESPAGDFKGRDPAIPVEELRRGWTDESPVLYIGKSRRGGESGHNPKPRRGRTSATDTVLVQPIGVGVRFGNLRTRHTFLSGTAPRCLTIPGMWRDR